METVIKHNRVSHETWIEESGKHVLNSITHIDEEDLNQMIENREVKRVNGQSDTGVNGDKRVNPIEVYEIIKKEDPDNSYTKVQIDINYNAKMLYYDGDEIQYSEILEWPEFCTLENCDHNFRIYTIKKEWVPALFDQDIFLRAKKCHLNFEKQSAEKILHTLEYEHKEYSQRYCQVQRERVRLNKEILDMPFCRICGELMHYEQEMPVAEKMMYSWTCPECKNSEMRNYKKV